MGKKTDLDIEITLGKTNCPFPSTRSNSNMLQHKQGFVSIKSSYKNEFVPKLVFTTKRTHLRSSRVLRAGSDAVTSTSCTVIWVHTQLPHRIPGGGM